SVFETTRMVSAIETERMRVFDLYSDGVVFFVNSFDRPRSRETLDHFAKYHLNGDGLTPTGDTSLSGFAGREYRMSYSYGNPPLSFYGGARVFRTKRHAYLVQAFSEEEGHSQAVERFLNSLVLSANPSGRPVADDEPVPP